jgi:RimJ/RimL family protein N-acetyltransferase
VPEKSVDISADGKTMRTARLVLRPWSADDADAALAIYGSDKVARWLAPAMSRVVGLDAMRELMSCWAANCAVLEAPAGRWAIERQDDNALIGGVALLPLPPYGIDHEIAWQLAPAAWGHGYGAEAGHAVAHYAFTSGMDELFAVVRPGNEKGARTARRVGMEWVGETKKYYNLNLQVYRLRRSDLDLPDLVIGYPDGRVDP